jgi:hypothetical protein
MMVGSKGRFSWHVNPSTRPVVESRQTRVLAEEPTSTFEETGTQVPPTQHVDVPYTLEEDRPGLLQIRLDWELPDDMDLEVYRRDGDDLVEVGSSGNFVDEKERVLLEKPRAGEYVLRVINYASVSPTWTVTAETFQSELRTIEGLVGAWTLTCEVDGRVLEKRPVVVDRGEIQKVNLTGCLRAAKR